MGGGAGSERPDMLVTFLRYSWGSWMVNLDYVIYRKMANLNYAFYQKIDKRSSPKVSSCCRIPILHSLLSNGSGIGVQKKFKLLKYEHIIYSFETHNFPKLAAMVT